MRTPDFSIYDTKCGFEFEFYSHLSKDSTKNSLQKALGVKIELAEYHSEIEPTDKLFKLEPDNSGGKNLHELVTGPLPYNQARLILSQVSKWIAKNGWTSDRCGIHLNLSFDSDKYGPEFLSRMNKLAFILELDESIIYKFFPEREDNTYAKSVKWVYPMNPNFLLNTNTLSKHQFLLPEEKYYGVNFLKLEKNYLEFRYLGGKGYEKKVEGTTIIWEHFLRTMFTICIQKQYTDTQIYKLQSILKKHQVIIEGTKDSVEFKKSFPDIKFTVDLNDNDINLSTYWEHLKIKIVKLLTVSGLKEGKLNYDTDRGVLQIKDAKLKSFYSEGIEIIDSKLDGNFINCDIYNCTGEDAFLEQCDLYMQCELKDSRLKNCEINKYSTILNSYVFGLDTVFRGKMKDGVFREGKIAKSAEIDKSVNIVDQTKL